MTVIGRSLCRDSSFFSSSVDTSLIRPERALGGGDVCTPKAFFANVDVNLDHFRQCRSPDDEEVVEFLHFRESSSGSLSIAS